MCSRARADVRAHACARTRARAHVCAYTCARTRARVQPAHGNCGVELRQKQQVLENAICFENHWFYKKCYIFKLEVQYRCI